MKKKENRSLLLYDAPWQEALPVLQELTAVLEENRFEDTRILPEPGQPQHLLLDLANLARVGGGGSNLFHQSAIPWLYRALVRLRNRRAEELFQVFHRCSPVNRNLVEKILPGDLSDRLVDSGVLETVSQKLQTRLETQNEGDRAVTDRAITLLYRIAHKAREGR